MAHEQKVLLYHGKCIDGFGGAYAAWKKFDDSVEYIPVSYGKPVPAHLAGRDIILVDFCYPGDVMEELKKTAKSLVVLDHHEGVRGVATRFEGVFDASRSGATIAWEYFHPGTPIPELLKYVEDGDLYRHTFPETEDMYSYLIVEPYDFVRWDEIVHELADPESREKLLAKARAYTEYFEKLAYLSVVGAKKVKFEGYEIGFGITHPAMAMKSFVGHELCKKYPPVALVVSAHPDGFGVSIRGDGSVDVAAIARKYGGDGHKNSSGFFIPLAEPVPWEEIKS